MNAPVSEENQSFMATVYIHRRWHLYNVFTRWMRPKLGVVCGKPYHSCWATKFEIPY